MTAGARGLAVIEGWLRPGLWPILLVPPLVVLAVVAARRAGRRRLVEAVGERGVRAALRAGGGTPGAERGSLAMLALGLVLGGVALLGPVGGERDDAGAREGLAPGADVVLCLDVSRSMRARDVAPDRLTHAAREIEALVARPSAHRFALVVYAGEARLVAPLTHDGDAVAALAALADPSDVTRGGADLGAALDAALDAAAGARGDASRPVAAAILIGDGGASTPDAGRAAAAGAKALQAAARCAAAGVRVHALAVGTSLGGKLPVPTASGETWLRDRTGAEVVVPLDAAPLEAVTRAAGGVVRWAAPEPGALAALVAKAVVPLARRAAEEERLRRRPSHGPWLAGLALVCLLGPATLPGLRAGGRGAARSLRRAAAAALLAALGSFLAACGDATRDDARRALDDLGAGRLAQAEAAADRLAAGPRGDGPATWRSLSASVRAHVAWARSTALQEEAGASAGPGSLPLEFALAQAEDAAAAWREAVRLGWGGRDVRPEARNVQRAMRRVDALRARLGRKPPPAPPGGPDGPDAPPDRPAGAPPPVAPPPEGDPAAPDVPPEVAPEVAADDLPPEAVLGLLEALARKESEKRATRRAAAAPPPVGEEDW